MPLPPAFESSFYDYFLDVVAAEDVAEGFEEVDAGVFEAVELDGFIWPSLKISFLSKF